jgi:hypothetical protein
MGVRVAGPKVDLMAEPKDDKLESDLVGGLVACLAETMDSLMVC